MWRHKSSFLDRLNKVAKVNESPYVSWEAFAMYIEYWEHRITRLEVILGVSAISSILSLILQIVKAL